MAKTIEEFFQEYEQPAIQNITVGFSGIDPVPKSFTPVVISDKTDTGEDIHAYIDNKVAEQLVKAHEELPDLQGGNDNEHYHLTEKEYNDLYKVLEAFSNPNGAVTLTSDEYDKAAAIIAALYPNEDATKPHFSTHEELEGLLGGNADGHYHLTEDEVSNLSKLAAAFINSSSGEIILPETGEGGEGTAISSHEALQNLLGGDAEGHYHLTEAETENLGKLITALIGANGEVEIPSSGEGGITNHEELEGLQGGSNNEHYHLTQAELDKLNDYPAYDTLNIPSKHDDLSNLQGGADGEHYHLTAEEYEKVQNISDTTTTQEGGVTDHEELTNLQGGSNGEHYHLTESEAEKLGELITALIGTDGEVSLPEGTQSEGTTSHEALEDLLGGSENAHYHLTKAELDKLKAYPEFDILSIPSLHDDLGGLQGGKTDEHYHLTEAELEKLQAVLADLYPNGATEPQYPSSGEEGTAVTVEDNLTSTSTTNALSANQGRVLKGMIDAITDNQDYILTTEEFNTAVDERITDYHNKNKIIDCGEINTN